MFTRALILCLLALPCHAQTRSTTHRLTPAATSEKPSGDADFAMRKLANATDSGFSSFRGDYHGPGARWESKFMIPGALFCNVDWRKQDEDSVGTFYCDMGEHYTYMSAAEAMNRFSDPIRRVLPTWRGIVKSDGNHPDFSDSDIRLFMAPHFQGERSPSVSFERKKNGDEYMVVFFFSSVMSPEELISKYGGPAADDLKIVEYDYGRLINDLIEAQAKNWMMNRFTSGSAVVMSYGKTVAGEVVKLDARYEFTGVNGPAVGSVTMTMQGGAPQCLYFFDFPQVCRPADPVIAADFANNQYIKR